MCITEDIVALVDWKDAMWFLGAMGMWLLSAFSSTTIDAEVERGEGTR